MEWIDQVTNYIRFRPVGGLLGSLIWVSNFVEKQQGKGKGGAAEPAAAYSSPSLGGRRLIN
jgi:hypothetical protein